MTLTTVEPPYAKAKDFTGKAQNILDSAADDPMFLAENSNENSEMTVQQCEGGMNDSSDLLVENVNQVSQSNSTLGKEENNSECYDHFDQSVDTLTENVVENKNSEELVDAPSSKPLSEEIPVRAEIEEPDAREPMQNINKIVSLERPEEQNHLVNDETGADCTNVFDTAPEELEKASMENTDEKSEPDNDDFVEETYEEGTSSPQTFRQEDSKFKYDPKNSVSFFTPEEELSKMNIPNGSRLYVGNLPLNYDSKEEIAKVFAKYGDILSISFETGKRTVHGLVQFKTKEACAMALKNEDRRLMDGGFKLDLHDDYERNFKAKDPPSGKSNESKSMNTKRRSNSPMRRDNKRKNTNDRSHRAKENDSSVYRQYKDIPDAQIIVLGNVNSQYIDFIKNCCRNQNIYTDLAYFNPKSNTLPEMVSLHQKEGVFGIIFLEQSRQKCGTVALQIFNRNGPPHDYDNISIIDACGHIQHARKNNGILLKSPVNPQTPFDPNILVQFLATNKISPELLNNLMILLANMQQSNQPIQYHQPQASSNMNSNIRYEDQTQSIATMLSQLNSNAHLLESIRQLQRK